MHKDLVIEVDNEPGALARVAAAVSDAGVNLAAATCLGNGERAQMHILVHHPEATKHALALSNLAVTHEHDVVVVDVEDEPGVLADLARRVAKAGVSISTSSTWRRTTVSCSVPRTPPPSRPRWESPPASDGRRSGRVADRRHRLQRPCPRRLGEVLAGRGVEDLPRRAEQQTGAVGRRAGRAPRRRRRHPGRRRRGRGSAGRRRCRGRIASCSG